MTETQNTQVLDIYNYTKQGNIAVDMCVACILHNRRFDKPIKAIILSKAYYSIFKKWVRINFGEEIAAQEFAIDTVEIRTEIIISGKSLTVEYYE